MVKQIENMEIVKKPKKLTKPTLKPWEQAVVQ